jgi:phosphatidylserine/phosphatidylglycerophosphate/cardiolipin synthase-like enzyme
MWCRVRFRFFHVLFLVLTTSNFIFSQSLSAKIYPASFSKNTDILMIDRPHVDEIVRLSILNRARRSIDIVSHLQSANGFGLRVINTLQRKMGQGVTVRYLYERFAGLAAGEIRDRATRLLTDSRFYQPNNGSEIITCRPAQKLVTPFSVSDFFHQKIIIVDRGTPNEVIMVGGRNHDTSSEWWSDFTFVLRQVHQGQPYAGDQIGELFDSVFAFAKRYYSAEAPTASEPEDVLWQMKQRAGWQWRKSQASVEARSKAREVTRVLGRAPVSDEHLQNFQFRPTFLQVVSNDVLSRIAAGTLEKSFFARPSRANDDIVRALAGLLSQAYFAEFNTYLASMPDQIVRAARALLGRGGRLVINTNGGDAYEHLLPLRSLGQVANRLNIDTYFAILGNSDPGRLQFNQLSLGHGRSRFQEPIDFNHRKAVVLRVPDDEARVVLGSSNFTLTSSTKSDDFVVIVKDQRMADYVQSVSRKDCDTTCVTLDHPRALELKEKLTTLYRVSKGGLLSIF